MALPNFLIVGAAKCATDSLVAYLRQHPEVCQCRHDEANFFALDRLYRQGLPYYEQLFSHWRGERAIGEKSWRYSCRNSYPKAWPRIRATLGDIKAIYVAREPLERAKSMWRDLRAGGVEPVNANAGWSLLNDRIIVESSLYYAQIEPIVDDLGRERVLILLFEDFVRDPQGFYDRICDFLEISRFVPSKPIHTNVARSDDRADGRFARQLRRLGLVRLIDEWLPGLKPIGRRFLRRPLADAKIGAQAEAAFRAMVAEDSRRFLELAGKPADFWSKQVAKPSRAANNDSESAEPVTSVALRG